MACWLICAPIACDAANRPTNTHHIPEYRLVMVPSRIEQQAVFRLCRIERDLHLFSRLQVFGAHAEQRAALTREASAVIVVTIKDIPTRLTIDLHRTRAHIR